MLKWLENLCAGQFIDIVLKHLLLLIKLCCPGVLWEPIRETSSHATCHRTHAQSAQLTEPLWTDHSLKSGIAVCKLISTLKKKIKAQARSESLSLPSEHSQARRKPSLPSCATRQLYFYCLFSGWSILDEGNCTTCTLHLHPPSWQTSAMLWQHAQSFMYRYMFGGYAVGSFFFVLLCLLYEFVFFILRKQCLLKL